MVCRFWSEIELAYHYAKGQVIGITGTNGKTTTTALTGEIMAAHFGKDKTFVVGNIGTAYTGKALETKRRQCDSSRNQQLPVRDCTDISSACECNFKYHARPFKSP